MTSKVVHASTSPLYTGYFASQIHRLVLLTSSDKEFYTQMYKNTLKYARNLEYIRSLVHDPDLLSSKMPNFFSKCPWFLGEISDTLLEVGSDSFKKCKRFKVEYEVFT